MVVSGSPMRRSSSLAPVSLHRTVAKVNWQTQLDSTSQPGSSSPSLCCAYSSFCCFLIHLSNIYPTPSTPSLTIVQPRLTPLKRRPHLALLLPHTHLPHAHDRGIRTVQTKDRKSRGWVRNHHRVHCVLLRWREHVLEGEQLLQRTVGCYPGTQVAGCISAGVSVGWVAVGCRSVRVHAGNPRKRGSGLRLGVFF